MQVNLTDIYLDDEDEMHAIEVYIEELDYVYRKTSAKWMWLDSEWHEYTIKRVALGKQLRKVKVSL
jgi:hypothetical protein